MAERIELLQAGRAIAAVAVILYHAGLYSDGQFAYGFLGVDFFFVLSGFIIYKVAAGRPFDVRQFALKRFRRIFLPYWPIGVACAFAYIALDREFSLLASLFLLPGQPALTVAWSLQHELVFYCLAALFFSIRAPFLGAALWTAVICLRSFDPAPLGAWEHVLLSPRNLEFVIGMCLGRFLTLPNAPVGRSLKLLGDASYSLYLAHLPVMGIAWRMGGDFMTLAILGTIAGLAYYWFVERPLLCHVDRAARFQASVATQT